MIYNPDDNLDEIRTQLEELLGRVAELEKQGGDAKRQEDADLPEKHDQRRSIDSLAQKVFDLQKRLDEIARRQAGSDVEDNAPVGGTIRVDLSQDGGSDGDASSAASYTYTATSLDGSALGTALDPEWSRPFGKMTPATAGIGYTDSGGEFVLSIAFETPSANECS